MISRSKKKGQELMPEHSNPGNMYVVCTQQRGLLFEKSLIAMGFWRLLKNGLVLCSASRTVKQIVQDVLPRMLAPSVQQFLLSEVPIHRIIECLSLEGTLKIL